MKFRHIQDRRLDPPDEDAPEFDDELEEALYFTVDAAKIEQLEELYSLEVDRG